MRRTLLRTNLVLFLTLAISASELRADTISDAKLHFTLKLPPEFVPRPDLVGVTPDIVHAFQFGEATEGDIVILLLIEKMGGVIGRDRLKMPSGFKGDPFVTTWQGFEIDGIEVPEIVNGIDVVTYNVQIPLKREAIQIKLFGRADRKETLRALLRQVLDGLNGESNWFSSAAPSSVADSANYGMVLLCVGIGAIIAGLIILWFVSKWTPKGTVLVIAVAIYVVSWQIDDIRVREIRLLSGTLRMLGFAGGVLGLIDLLRKRKPKEVMEESPAPENVTEPFPERESSPPAL